MWYCVNKKIVKSSALILFHAKMAWVCPKSMISGPLMLIPLRVTMARRNMSGKYSSCRASIPDSGLSAIGILPFELPKNPAIFRETEY